MGVNQQIGYSQIVGPPVSGGDGSVSEWWSLPESPDPRDEEFAGGPGLPAGYAWWADSGVAAALVAQASVNNVTLAASNAPPASVTYKIGAAATGGRRRSWMQCQVPTGGSGDDPRGTNGYYLLKPYSPAANGCAWTRSHLPLNWLSGGSGVAGPMMYFVIMGQTAGVPDRNNMIMVGGQGQSGTGGNMNTNFYAVSGTSAITVPFGAFNFSQGGGIAGYGIRRRTSTLWTGYFMGSASDFYREVAEFNQVLVGGSFATFTPFYSGWKFVNKNAQGYNPIFGVDLHRFSDDANTLPL